MYPQWLWIFFSGHRGRCLVIITDMMLRKSTCVATEAHWVIINIIRWVVNIIKRMSRAPHVVFFHQWNLTSTEHVPSCQLPTLNYQSYTEPPAPSWFGFHPERASHWAPTPRTTTLCHPLVPKLLQQLRESITCASTAYRTASTAYMTASTAYRTNTHTTRPRGGILVLNCKISSCFFCYYNHDCYCNWLCSCKYDCYYNKIV